MTRSPPGPVKVKIVPAQSDKISEKAAPFDVERLRDVTSVRAYIDNVKRLGRTDLFPAAFRRLCELSGEAHDDPVVLEFWRAIAALEEVLRQTRGKTVRLSRTRQKIGRVGVLQTVEDLALAPTASDGFRTLMECGLGDLTAEYIVLRYPDRFSSEAGEAARKRLESAGIALPLRTLE